MNKDRRSVMMSLGMLSLAAAPAAAQTSTAATDPRDVFDNRQAVAAATVDPQLQHISTRSHSEPGDGGGAEWRRVNAEPPHPGKLKDAAGAWFELASFVITPEMFGAKGGDVDDRAALQDAVDYVTAAHRELRFLQPRYSIRGHLVVGANRFRFSFTGSAYTDLVQLQDNTSHFYFAYENTSYWSISNFRFLWTNDQPPTNTEAYAIRFNVERRGPSGHWNFLISDCLFWNGFRGAGISERTTDDLPCAIWGGSFVRLRGNERMTGALLYIRAYGKAGLPNNRVEHLYARCDRMVEPALVFENCDTLTMSNIEFNAGTGCRISVRSSLTVLIDGVRCEHVGLTKDDDAYFTFIGQRLRATLRGITVQTVFLNVPNRAAIVKAVSGAQVAVDEVVFDFNRRNVLRYTSAVGGMLDVVLLDKNSRATVGRLAPFRDPAVRLAGPDSVDRLFFANAWPLSLTVPDGSSAGNSGTALCTVPGAVGSVVVSLPGDGDGAAWRLVIERRSSTGGSATLAAIDVPKGRLAMVAAPGAGMPADGDFTVMPGDLLSARVEPASAASPASPVRVVINVIQN